MNRKRFESTLLAIWYGDRPPPFGLRFLSHVFRAASGLRRKAYRHGLLRSRRVSVPVVVIGNITVGGSGKTPLTIWLAQSLRERGIRVGIVARGYGGQARVWPQIVTPDSDPAQVGDEAVLMARATSCRIVVGPDRAACAMQLATAVDIILADDGLQHYALARDFEVVVIDGERGLGNGYLLPAGPLREPATRLSSVDCVIERGGTGALKWGTARITLALQDAVALTGDKHRPLASFSNTTVHAVAGIGHPQQFFNALRDAGLEIVEHAFPDHAALTLDDVDFDDTLPVLMTEKDAIKLPGGAAGNGLWAVPAQVQFNDTWEGTMLARITNLIRVS